jgi:hypothetical protein
MPMSKTAAIQLRVLAEVHLGLLMTGQRVVAGIAAGLAVLTIGAGTAQASTPYQDGIYEGQTAMVSYANSAGWTLPLTYTSSAYNGSYLIDLCADLFTQRYPAGSHRFPFDRYPGTAADAYRGGFISGCVHTSVGATP